MMVIVNAISGQSGDERTLRTLNINKIFHVEENKQQKGTSLIVFEGTSPWVIDEPYHSLSHRIAKVVNYR